MYYPLRTMCEVETMAGDHNFSKFILNWIYPKYLPQRNNYFFLLTINIIEFSITYNDNLIKRIQKWIYSGLSAKPLSDRTSFDESKLSFKISLKQRLNSFLIAKGIMPHFLWFFSEKKNRTWLLIFNSDDGSTESWLTRSGVDTSSH